MIMLPVCMFYMSNDDNEQESHVRIKSKNDQLKDIACSCGHNYV